MTGQLTFAIDIPPNFQRDVLGGRQPAIQVNVDATAMMQAGIGAGYIQQIISTEIADPLPATIPVRFRRSICRFASRSIPISRPPGSPA